MAATFRLTDGSEWAGASASMPRFRLPVQSPVKTGAYSLVTGDSGTTIPCDASGGGFTVTVPSGPTLGEGFVAEIQNTGPSGTVTIDGPGGTNPTLASDESLLVRVVDNVVRGAKATWPAL